MLASVAVMKATLGKMVALTVALVLIPLSAQSTSPSEGPAQDEIEAFENSTEYAEIYGGTTQSVDPTRYDYVPPVTAGGIQPFSATGVGSIPGFSFTLFGVTFAVPKGILSHTIITSGLTIKSESSIYTPASLLGTQICDYKIDYQNRDGSTIYSTVNTGLHDLCLIGVPIVDNYNTSRTVKTGKLCARFFVSGTFRGEQCHNVHA